MPKSADSRKISNSKATRKLQKPQYKTLKLSKKIRGTNKPLPKARHIFSASIRHIWQHKKVFLGITLVYFLCTLLVVKGLSSPDDLSILKDDIQAFLTGVSGQIITGITLFGLLLGESAATDSEVGGTYQAMVLVVVSLALIWALRQTYAGKHVGIRDSFYKGMYPLIPFLLVLVVIGLQSIPLAVASWLFGVTITAGLAVTGAEQFLWGILCFLLVLLTIYMISSSLFALYVSTLPDMTPMKALRSARELVRHRRWEVVRKVLYLPLVLLVLAAIIMVPVILYLTPIAEPFFILLSMAALAVSHSYLYGLYRELL